MPKGRPKKEAPNRADGRYEVKMVIGHDISGKGISKSFYSYISKDDAKRQGWEYMEKQIAGKAVELAKNKNFTVWANRWLEVYKKGKVKANTYIGTYYDVVHRYLIPHFGKMDLTDIKPVMVQEFFDEQGEKYSLETLRKMRANLHAIFETAIENDLCYKNPVTKNMNLASKSETPDKKSYTCEQYNAVLAFARQHKDGLCVMVLLETGISRSELLGLKWDNINHTGRCIDVVQGTVDIRGTDNKGYKPVTEGLKNAYRKRQIPINDELLTRLLNKPRKILRGGNRKKGTLPIVVKPEFVFHSPDGAVFSPKNWMNRVYVPFMEDMHAAHPDIPILNPHELRHTAATLWKDNGVDLFSIARLLGHSDLDMLSKRYAHDNLDTVRAAIGLDN